MIALSMSTLSNFHCSSKTNIYKNKIAIANYEKDIFGMIIESEEIARSQKAVFELAWRGAEDLQIKN